MDIFFVVEEPSPMPTEIIPWVYFFIGLMIDDWNIFIYHEYDKISGLE